MLSSPGAPSGKGSVAQYSLRDNDVFDDLEVKHPCHDDIRAVFIGILETLARMDDPGAEYLVRDPGLLNALHELNCPLRRNRIGRHSGCMCIVQRFEIEVYSAPICLT